ncbi:NADP-dependent oxidoreductase [Streptacidiphilus anmyonensis]|uniref:NADP-dependent oxidoreductase n=1 Tax=Streptacidiphilus anmyonensis TaxID=405782 RepID=UPI0005A913B3|nr:NADP-dependent oxidoreductase [Streptacidiphilus anmyonensis]
MTATMRAVRFDHYGGRDVLRLAEVEIPSPGPGELLVKVVAAGINPGEAAIRSGALHDRFPATFPSGQGSDFAGVVVGTGAEVLGWTWDRASHAGYVVVPEAQVVPKPAGLDWEAAGSLCVAGATAFAATRALAVREGDVVAVSAAAGGVGSIAVQLLRRSGATVLAIASEANHAWLAGKGAIPVAYGPGLFDALEPYQVDAFVDLHGPEDLDLAVRLGVRPSRINTVIAFDKAAEIGARTDGSTAGTSAEVLAHLADLAATGQLELPIAATFPLADVRRAFELVEARHTHGKVVLLP